jgi:hypothetical protein
MGMPQQSALQQKPGEQQPVPLDIGDGLGEPFDRLHPVGRERVAEHAGMRAQPVAQLRLRLREV